MSNNTRERYGYMCYVDYLHEVGEGPTSPVYSSIKAIKEAMKCVEQCGIVEVEIKKRKVVQDEDFSGLKSQHETNRWNVLDFIRNFKVRDIAYSVDDGVVISGLAPCAFDEAFKKQLIGKKWGSYTIIGVDCVTKNPPWYCGDMIGFDLKITV